MKAAAARDDEDDDTATTTALASFQEWLQTLSWNDLQDCLEFQVDDPQESELLRQMVQLQPPLPTPIHPRAVPFVPASVAGKFYYDQRFDSGKQRLSRPRLFQWIPKISSMQEQDLLAIFSGKSSKKKQSMKNSSVGGRRNNNKKKQNGSSNNNRSLFSSCDVIAKQFRQLDGLIDVGCSTVEQQSADNELLTRTVLRSMNGDAACYSCRLDYSDDDENNNCSSSILELLRIASRGNFGSAPIEISSINNNMVVVLPAWFDPQDRWFTLSMYLASRFEVALWNAYYSREDGGSGEPSSETPLPLVPDSILSSMYTAAVGQAVKEILNDEQILLASSKCQVRDGLLWNLLVDNNGSLLSVAEEGRTVTSIVKGLWSCPVVELGSKSEILRRKVRDRMQLLIAVHVEKSLLHELSDDTRIMNNTTKKPGGRKKRKKKRRRKKTNSGEEEKPVNGMSSPVGVETTGVQQSLEDVSSSSENESTDNRFSNIADQKQQQDTTKGERVESNDIAYPNNNTSSRDRNCNIVLARSILDDVVANVFVQVGLSEDATSETTNLNDEKTLSMTEDASSGDEPFRLVAKGGKATCDAAAKSARCNTVLVRPRREKAVSAASTPSNETIQKSKAGTTAPHAVIPGGRKKVEEQQQQQQPAWNFDDHQLFPSIRESEYTSANIDQFAQFTPPAHTFEADNSATLRTSNLEGLSSGYNSLSPGFFHRPDNINPSSWDMPGYPAVDNWGRFQGFVGRNESILSEFFHSQEQAGKNNDEIMASSTAASIASSTDNEGDEEDEPSTLETVDTVRVAFSADDPEILNDGDATADKEVGPASLDLPQPETPPQGKEMLDKTSPNSIGNRMIESGSFQSPSPPSTPPPTLSPILVSLSDLSEMRRGSLGSLEIPSTPPRPMEQTKSVPASPQRSPPRMVSSMSREDLSASASVEASDGKDNRKGSLNSSDPALSYKAVAKRPARSRDDHDIKGKALSRRSTDALSTYRNALARPGNVSRDDHDIKPPVARETPARFSSYRSVAARTTLAPSIPSAVRKVHPGKPYLNFESMLTGKQKEENLSTRSETALDGQDDYQNWHELRPSQTNEEDNNTVTKDGSTTITSALSQREPEEVLQLKEERNSYRDMCLTLGAEVAKLRNQLAAQTNTALYPTVEFPAGHGHHPFRGNGFDPESVNHPSFHTVPRARTLAAMSDAGYRAEHESLTSEDDFAAKMVIRESPQQISSGITVAESDASIDRNSGHNLSLRPTGFQQPIRDFHDPVSMNGMQSRLAQDIFQFLETTNAQLRKQDAKRQKAVLRMTRLVNTVWPRAQVKLYGSHVTGLCLPSSDLDFIICLPAVHKNAVADAPGALEGRNAVNETSQRLLARRLKGESWIDPRSMKLIEKTVVPVIKVATKDTRAKTLQLDISFDAPNHHGLEAVHMVSQIIDELPMIRPLVIVLKQFLIDRGLLTAYTGGLSSYCLFLMVARYLQEQTGMGDCGSLLMGFLDFYGNCFDPRSTGISVLYRQYFARPNYAAVQNQTRPWVPIPHAQVKPMPIVSNVPSYARRNSFSDKGSASVSFGARPTMARPPTFHSPAPPNHEYNSTETTPDLTGDQNAFDHGMPYTFDPLFVEDPLAEGNNVGRNAFRIVQVQRCFSDAHRALSSALEWDMHSASEMQDANEFPLLKCLLQSEDVVFDL